MWVVCTRAFVNPSRSPETRTLANLFQRVWDKRLPGDGDSFIVLNESPTCVKNIMHALHQAREGLPTLSHLRPEFS